MKNVLRIKSVIFAIVYCACTMFNIAHAGWSPPVRISEFCTGYYPKIIAQGDTLHAIYTHEYSRRAVNYIRSTDHGQTWGGRRVLNDTINSSSAWNPQLIRNGNRLMALYLIDIWHQVYPTNIACSISNDDGLTWLPPRYVLQNNVDGGFHFAASGSDSLINIMAACTIINDSVYFSNIRSTNFGQSWSAPRPIFSQVQNNVPDQTSKGSFVHFTWAGCFDIDSSWEVYYLNSSNGGQDWSDNIPVSEHDRFHSYWPAICVNDMDVIRLSWMDFKYSPYLSTGDIFLRNSLDSGTIWTPEMQVTDNHLANISDIISNGDTIVIAWEDKRYEDGRGSIYCTKSIDGGINWDEPYWVDGDTNNSINPAIATSNGRIYVVWYDIRSPDSLGLFFSRYDPDNDAIGNDDIDNTPDKLLLSAYPNPFNSTTIIMFETPQPSDVELTVFNILGQKVKTLVNEKMPAGSHTINWNGTNQAGQVVSSGLYFYQLKSDDQATVKKLLLLK
jgi:hypothetical protein